MVHTLPPTTSPTLQKVHTTDEVNMVMIRKQSNWLLIFHFGSFRNSVWLLLVKNIWQTWLE